VKGADAIVRDVSEHYGLAAGTTSDDRRLTLRTARCIGSCGLAPVVVLDGAVLAHEDPASTLAAVARAFESDGA